MWRYTSRGKNTVDEYSQTIDIKFLKKFGYLDSGVSFKSWWLYWSLNGQANGNIAIEIKKGEREWHVRVHFTQTNRDWEKKDFDYKIPLVTTPCNYWWVRWWFLCPCKWNRCSILYFQSNGIFASRKTLDLCYEDQQRSREWRLFNKIFPREHKAEELYKTIKYPYRNGKETRKYRQYKKIMLYDIPDELLLKRQLKYLRQI